MQNDREQRRIRSELVGATDGSDPFAAAVRATRMPMLITDPRQPDNPIVFCNDAFARLTGYEREETLGRNCRFLQGPESDRDDIAKMRTAIEERRGIEIELLNYKKNGETFWNRLLISPVFDGGELTYFFASQFDVTLQREHVSRLRSDRASLEVEIEQRISDLTKSEERLSFALRAGRLGAWTLDLESGRLIASPLCREIFGRKPEDPFAYADLQEALAEEDRLRFRETIHEAIRNGTDFAVECRRRSPGEDARWVEIRGRPGLGADGKPISVAGVMTDISERKRAEGHRTLLVRELNHRVKNTLATVQSIVRQSLRSKPSVAEAAEAADARIRALSMAHDVLTDENWSGASLADLATRSLRPFIDEAGGRLRILGEPIRLKPRSALAIAMALHELATNATRFGALSSDRGHVTLEWWVASADAGDRLLLRWTEKDGPAIPDAHPDGFGTRLIEKALASELGGTARIEFREEGLVCTVEAPLASLTGDPD